MPKIPNATLRHNTWYIRLRVPKDLLAAYHPRKEVTQSLKTGDFKKARQRVTVHKAQIEGEFETKRVSLNAPTANPDRLSLLTEAEVQKLVMDSAARQERSRPKTKNLSK